MKRGRPKGYSPYINISYEELADWVGRKAQVPVSKKWLEALMVGSEEQKYNVDKALEEIENNNSEEKIEYTLTEFNDE